MAKKYRDVNPTIPKSKFLTFALDTDIILPADDAAAFNLIGSLVNGTNIFGIGLQFAEINISANDANLMSLSTFAISVYCKGNGASGTAYRAVKEQAGKYSNNH